MIEGTCGQLRTSKELRIRQNFTQQKELSVKKKNQANTESFVIKVKAIRPSSQLSIYLPNIRES